jgi:hypothetical protein
VISVNADILDERRAGCRPFVMVGLPGVVILADSNALDERVDGCRDPGNGPDMDKRAAGYRLFRWTLMSWMVGWPGVVLCDGL